MEKSKRTKEETISYFKQLAYDYAVLARRSSNFAEVTEARAKSEAYRLATFELEKNMV